MKLSLSVLLALSSAPLLVVDANTCPCTDPVEYYMKLETTGVVEIDGQDATYTGFDSGTVAYSPTHSNLCIDPTGVQTDGGPFAPGGAYFGLIEYGVVPGSGDTLLYFQLLGEAADKCHIEQENWQIKAGQTCGNGSVVGDPCADEILFDNTAGQAISNVQIVITCCSSQGGGGGGGGGPGGGGGTFSYFFLFFAGKPATLVF